MYCWKREYAHLPNGLCVSVSPAFPGSVHDMTIFQRMAPTYGRFLTKAPVEAAIPDSLQNQNSWAALVDLGYVGANEHLRVVVPRRRDPHAELTEAEAQRNVELARARVICENFYGRKWKKFEVMASTWKGDGLSFERVSNVCVALTNFDVINRPLNQGDYVYHTKLLKNRQR